MMLFGQDYPTTEQSMLGYEHDPDRKNVRPNPCITYHWCGQDFAYCDNCGTPCWQHPYQPGVGPNTGLRKKQLWEDAYSMWQRWGEPKGIPFRVSRPCLASRDREH